MTAMDDSYRFGFADARAGRARQVSKGYSPAFYEVGYQDGLTPVERQGPIRRLLNRFKPF